MTRRKTRLLAALAWALAIWPAAFFGQEPRVISVKQGLAGETQIEIGLGTEAGVKPNMKGHVYFLEKGDQIKIAFFVVTRVDVLISEARITSFTELVRAGHFLSFDEPLVPPPPSGFLDISTSADPASFFIDGKRAGTTPDRPSLNAGTYKLRIVKDGYRDHEETIMVHAGRETKIEAILGRIPERTYKVLVTSAPEGAKVSINGTDRGLTPLSLDLPRNSYRIRIEKEGYKPVEESLAVSKDILDKSFFLEKLGYGTIELDAYPPAELEINGESYGEVPPAIKVILPEGQHKIRLYYFRQKQVREHTIIVTKEKTEAKRFRLDVAFILSPVS